MCVIFLTRAIFRLPSHIVFIDNVTSSATSVILSVLIKGHPKCLNSVCRSEMEKISDCCDRKNLEKLDQF